VHYDIPVPPTRQPRSATPEKRRRIIDAAERIMIRDGYAAVTSRRVEAECGIKLHYHLGSLDDLFIAVVRRHGQASIDLLADALASPAPLGAWWRLVSDQRGNTLLVELTAAANHRPAMKAEVATFAREVRRMQVEALETILDRYRIDRRLFPPALVAAAVQGLAFSMAHDQVSGFATGHEEASAAMSRLIEHFEGPSHK
jgi:AcrR family transcriptional regulator